MIAPGIQAMSGAAHAPNALSSAPSCPPAQLSSDPIRPPSAASAGGIIGAIHAISACPHAMNCASSGGICATIQPPTATISPPSAAKAIDVGSNPADQRRAPGEGTGVSRIGPGSQSQGHNRRAPGRKLCQHGGMSGVIQLINAWPIFRSTVPACTPHATSCAPILASPAPKVEIAAVRPPD